MKPNDTLIESNNSNCNSNDSTVTNDCETFLLPRFNFQPFINAYHEYQYFNHNNNAASMIQQNNVQMLTPVFKINSNFQFPLFNHDPTQISWNLTSENFFNSSLTNLVARFNE